MSDRNYKTGLYGRTSKDDAKTVTIETQQKTLRDWLTTDPQAVLVDEYWDPGISGKIPIWERPAGRILMDDVRTGKLEAVAVAFADRFGRTLLDGLQAVKELESLGAKLTCVNEGWDARRNDSPLYMQFRFMIAEEEHRRIRERMEGGKVRAISRDNAPPGGSLTFGYQLGKNGQFTLDPDEAPLVILIFQKFLAGDSIATILVWLSTTGVRPGQKFQKRGSPEIRVRADQVNARWNRNKVWDILHNETYLGVRKWKEHRFPCPQLIDPRSFASVQAKLAETATGTNKSDPEKSLLSGLFRCSLCRAKYFRHTSRNRKRGEEYSYYSCSNSKVKNPGDVYCPAKVVPIEWLDKHVWGMLEQYLRDPEALIRKIIEADTGRSLHAVELAAEIDDVLTGMQSLDAQAAGIWEAQVAHNWPIAWVTPRINALLPQKQALEDRLKTLRRQHSAVTFSREDSANVLAEVARLRNLLDAGLTVQEKAAFIRQVWADGLITTKGQRWKKEATIHFEFKWGELVTPSVSQNQCQLTRGVESIGFDLLRGRDR